MPVDPRGPVTPRTPEASCTSWLFLSTPSFNFATWSPMFLILKSALFDEVKWPSKSCPSAFCSFSSPIRPCSLLGSLFMLPFKFCIFPIQCWNIGLDFVFGRCGEICPCDDEFFSRFPKGETFEHPWKSRRAGDSSERNNLSGLRGKQVKSQLNNQRKKSNNPSWQEERCRSREVYGN